MRKTYTQITKLFNGKLRFRGAELEYASGKTESLESLQFQTKISQTEVRLFAELKEYTAEFIYRAISENSFACKAIVTPKGEVKDKIKKITGLKAFKEYSSDALLVKNDFVDTGIVCRDKKAKEGISEDYLCVYEKDSPEKAVVFTAQMEGKFYSRIAYKQRAQGIEFKTETLVPLSFEGKIESEEWLINTDKSAVEAFENSVSGYEKSDEFAKPVGWSTWDYYFTAATEEDVKANVDFIAADETLGKKLRYIALDDGWQQREGDWRSGIRYPSGLKATVDYIKAKGFEGGVWVAPTRLHFLCATVMRRNDFLVRDENGDPIMDEDMYVLDPTHPDGEKFLRETFAYLKECGFTFYKLDFVSNLLKVERFYDKTVGPYDALRRLFKIARECVGEESHLMGCSLPYRIGKGIAESRRSGLDIHNTYGHLKKCLEIAWWQLSSNERVHRLDLDYLVVRGKDTTEEEKTNVLNPSQGKYRAQPTTEFRWRDGEDFSYSEAKSWCGIILMSGSSIFLGDNLPLLNEKGLSLVKTVLNNADFHSATPEIKRGEGLPEVWRKENSESVYIFNFDESEKEYSVVLEKGGYTEIFEGAKYQVEDGLRVKIPPHDCLCLKKN